MADPELLRPLLEARRPYLQASFNAVYEKYGSVDRYVTKGLGIAKATIRKLRHNLLATRNR